MAASKILLLLAVGLLIGGAAASCGALKESRRASSRGRGAGRSMWALVLVLSGGTIVIVLSRLLGSGGSFPACACV